ncbi:MAG: hypothetical protein A3I09_02010 [Deltaproteobacteria bacterium RIFCSPLOWO2_02_FULL_47_10]|nr:MAG: hypothetical protein A3I09_02010 [Deltaproteobacteria bacterium RIFCSPLOWO2_02_FULL_47_10]
MTKKILVVFVALSMLAAGKAWTADTKAAPAKAGKVTETRINETDLNRLEFAVNKAVKEAYISKQGSGGWEYMAKRMRPPKNEKWQGKWNGLGGEGWEAIDHFENVYIFKRPAVASSSYAPARVKPAASPAVAEPAAVAPAEDDKAAEKAAKKAEKEAEKATKKAEKDSKKAAKKAEKEAKKAAKEKEKGK